MNKIIFIDKGRHLRMRQTLVQDAFEVSRTVHTARHMRPQLVCRWQVDPCTGRLFCAWTSEDAEEPGSRRLRVNHPAANGPTVLRAA
ncbi:hypothetical protein [Hyphomicrobium sp. 2TAF46]|uniref:hypothetical protein n=1 Tax=Hyphomicrobium sp. 2TAF46 TaxID=3233019 RepID=UPI003F8E3B77